jgi:hypothetical protein
MKNLPSVTKTVTSQHHHSNPNFLSGKTSIPCIIIIIWSSHSVHVLHLLNDKLMSSIALENIQGKPQNKDLSSQLGWTLKWSLRLDCEESYCLLIQKSPSFVKRFCSWLFEILSWYLPWDARPTISAPYCNNRLWANGS